MPQPAHAAGLVNLKKTASGSVLVGGVAEYHLAATNPTGSGVEQYNLSYVDVLPAGVTYVSGSTAPAGFGEPQVTTVTDPSVVPPVTRQVLIWSNVADLTPGSTRTLTFKSTVDSTTYPVGSSVTNTASAFTSSDPREVPSISDQGALVGGVNVVGSTSSATTAVTAVSLSKAEASPEAELLRGVNDHQTAYSLTVTNNGISPTTGVAVVDYLPAGLEFLGCGGAFHSATPEYPGASNAVAPVVGCESPASVETVQDPAGYPAGVYTKVTWNLSDLAAGAAHTITYAAGIPQRANTMTWLGTEPTGSGAQAANLDNNNGASTRENGVEQPLTNYATVSGTFRGKAVSDSTTHTVTAEDLRLVKSVTPGSFVQGQLATYTLNVDASEYVDLSALQITDTIPNGLCPVDATTNWTSLADCAAQAGHGPTNATISNVVSNPDGSFTVTFVPSQTALAHDGHLTITYQALMRESYVPASSATGSTSANDTFTNHAVIAGTSDVRADTQSPDSGQVAVFDDSSATLSSSGPTLVKLRMANATPMTCSQKASDYTADVTGAEDAFTEGDRVCFLLQVQFPRGVATRNAQLTDFLPVNLTYESSTEVSPGGLVSSVSPATPTQYVTWTLGSGSPQVVPKGALLQIVVSAIVSKPAPLGTGTPQALDRENLAKFRYTNTYGQSDSLRDSVALPVGPPPPIGITKGVQAVGSTAVDLGATPGNVDGRAVRDGDLVTFRVDLQNLSTSGDVNGDAISSPDVWDVLPAGITCSAISAISDGGVCHDGGAPGRPVLASGDATSSIIRWQLGSAFTLAPQAYGKLTYGMQIPAGVSVSTVFTNTAAVASYASATNINDGGTVPVAIHNPSSNISASAADQDVPAASDTSSVVVPDAKVAKVNTTAITDAGNTAAQGVVGESVTYTVRVTIPAHTSVYNAKLVDPLPTGIAFVGPATALYAANGVSPATASLPSGVSVDAATGTLSFGSAYHNVSDTDQLFEVTIPARIGTDAGNTHGIVRTNTATFTSDSAATGGTAITPRTASSAVTVVEPSPSLTKTRAPSATAVPGGSTVTYTLTAGNAAGRPTLHDTVVTDCVPAGLVVGTITPPAGTSVTTTLNGCAASTGTLVTWTIGDIAGAGSKVLSYPAVVAAAAGGQSYVNNALLTGSSLADGTNDASTGERVYTKTATQTVRAAAATITKTPASQNLTIGARGAWTVTVTLPANLDFYDSIITDGLPAGMVVTGLTTDSTSCTGFTVCPVPSALTSSPAAPSLGQATTVGWGVGDIAASTSSRTITISYSATIADIGANTAGVARTNSAYFRWNLTDKGTTATAVTTLDQVSNTASATVTIVEPAMRVAKQVNDTTVEPGQSFTYTVVASNDNRAGNISAAYNYTVTDSVPVGVVVDPASLVGGVLTGTDTNGSGGTITWGPFAGPLAVNASTTFTYSATLAPSSTLTAAALTNTARVTHYESLASGGRTSYGVVTGTATVTPGFPHVTPTKSVAAGPAYLGVPKAWTITLTNDGAVDARHVSATDTLPASWTYDAGSATAVVAGGSATQVEPTLSVDGSGREVLTWADLGSAPASGVKTIVVTFTATPSDPAAVSVPGVGASVPHTNTVSATAQDLTGAGGNKSGPYNAGPATASTHIDSADVQIVKTSGTAVAGQNLAYTLTVKNNGPDMAVGPFPVVDALPAGLGAISWSGTGWTCSLATATVTCARTNPADTLASGAAFPVITVTAAVPAGTSAGTTLTNTASVGSTTYDPDHSNNTSSVTNTVARRVDLGIVKHTSGAVTAGADATYTLDVTNHGPSDAAGPIVVSDTLPAALSFVSAAGSGWTCAASGQTVTCTRAAGLVSGAAAAQITVVAHVQSGLVGTLTNTAQVKGPEADPNPANDSSSVTDPVTTSADLAITKAHVGTFTAGSTGTYEFTVVNNGPSDAAAQVRIVDQLAPELTFVSDDSSDWSCAANASNLLTCTLAGSLSVGQSRTFRISVSIDSAHTGDVVNSATVSSPTPDPLPGNNTDGDSTGVDVQADLGIVKSHQGDATAGQNLDFALAVTNHGQSDSPGPITVHDTLPAGMGFVSAAGTGWTCAAAGQDITCTRATGLGAGTSAPTITVKVAVASDAGPATLTNRASVAGTAPDPNPANNTASDDVTVVDRANVTITKTATPTTVNAGGNVTWTLTVKNQGPSDADNVAVSDSLPMGVEYVGIDAAAGLTCADANPIDCHVTSMPAGASYQILVHARIGSGVASGTTITNTATVSTSTDGDQPGDNSSSAAVAVTTSADLSITKTHPDTPVIAGRQMTFALDVRNAGPSDAAADVVVTDTLPAGMTYVGSVGSGWQCAALAPTASGQTVTCTLVDGAAVLAGTHAPALAVTVQVASDVDPASLPDGQLVNTATVTSPTSDPVPGNNKADDPVTIRTSADLSITKTHTGTVRIGDPLEFSLQVANNGPSTARQVVVTDLLPNGLDYVSATGTGWTCSTAARTVTCALDVALPSGGTASPIVVATTVQAAAYPQLTNTASVESTTPDPDNGNNASSDTVTVPPRVDLGIAKRHAPEPIQVGQPVTYTIDVSNTGTTDDPGPVSVTDTLPAGLTYVSGTGEGWSCQASGQDVTCVRAAGLTRAATTSITVVVNAGPQAYPGVVNTASVTSPAEDTNPDNNTATDPATILPLYDLVLAKSVDSISKTQADWTITVTNRGPNEAPDGAVVTDDLPAGLGYLDYVGQGWTCSTVGQLVTCVHDQAIAAGQTTSLTLRTSIDPHMTGTITNTASVESGNTATATGTIPSLPLPNTGGPSPEPGLVGLLLIGGGLLLIGAQRRRAAGSFWIRR